MKLIIENWRKFLSEEKEKTLRTAAIIWNNPSYKPYDEFKKDAGILKYILPEQVSQGHAGILLLREKKSGTVIIECFEFGVDNTRCKDANQKKIPLIDKLKKKFGLFVYGGVRYKRFPITYKEKANFFDAEDKSERIINILKSGRADQGNIKSRDAKQFGYIPNVNIESSKNYASSPSCRLYTVKPHLGTSLGDNCGSYVLKVAAAGLENSQMPGGKMRTAGEISENILGPDDVIPKLQELGWATIVQSFQ